MVYLEIEQAVGELFYSTPFLLTNIEHEKTTQFHYKDSNEDVYQSIGLQTWFDEEDKKTELTTYYEVSTKNTVSQAIKTSKIELFRTELMPKSVLIGLTYLLESPILYVNYIRCSLFEAIDLPLIRYIAKTGKPMIISTGMATEAEIAEAIAAHDTLRAHDAMYLHLVYNRKTIQKSI